VHEKGRIGDVVRPKPAGAVPPISPVAFRSPACRFFFIDDWLRHARTGESHPAPAPIARIAHPDTTPVGGVGFPPAQRLLAFGAAAPQRAGCPSHHGLRRRRQRQRQGRRQRQQAAPGTGAVTETGHGPRFRCRSRRPDTVLGSGVGHGRGRFGGFGSPLHRPSVTFGARRASVPARRPAVAGGVRRPRSITATSGRLDGLLGGCDALLRHAIPGGARHGIVPIETRTAAAQYRVLHARRCAISRAPLQTDRGLPSRSRPWFSDAASSVTDDR
jgi:hypothetical protein